MRQKIIYNGLLVVALVGVWMAGPASAGQLRAWGADSDGQISRLPTENTYIAVAAGDAHGLALRADGTIMAWGQNDSGQCNVPAGTYRAVAAGADFSLAIRTDGSLAAWGGNSDGQVSRAPTGKDFAAVDGGEAFAVALRANGSLVAWGNDRWGQVSGVPKGTGFTAVVAGDAHGVALRSDGSLASWGHWAAIQDTPARGPFTAIGAGGTFCVALRNDGSLTWWGFDPYDAGLAKVPAGNDYTALAAGYLHCLALKKDGSIVGWGAGTDSSGHPNWGQAKPPAGRTYTALAAGLYYSVALTGETVAPSITDNFDDNKQGTLWKLYADDSANCWLEEANRRLELRATGKTPATPAYYVSNGWRIDPTNGFSVKVDFYWGLRTDLKGWLTLGLAPDIDNLRNDHVEFRPGSTDSYPHLWYEAVNGGRTQTDYGYRSDTSGVLYVSYDAQADELYLSTTGYGADHAWRVVTGLVRGSWAGRPLWLYLGGGSEGPQIRSGDAYLDNFAVETGGVAMPPLSHVDRFWSPVLRRHFYTIDPRERDKLIKEYPKTWTYEGPVFQAAATPDAAGLAPVYRLWSPQGQDHFYTISVAEKDMLLAKYPKIWQLEGVAFYAYPEGAQPAASQPVFRFWHRVDNAHFYTIDPVERDRLLKEYAQVYTFEGVAFYAFK
jgi:alpha-tubulin suppressor-like RCC1 family protein